MLKFNDDNILTGEIKQLLSSFNLPTYRVYTLEQKKYHAEYEKYHDKAIGAIRAAWRAFAQACPEVGSTLAQFNAKLEAGQIKFTSNETLSTEYAKFKAVYDANKKWAYADAEKDVVHTLYRSNPVKYTIHGTIHGLTQEEFPERIQYMPYIKDGIIQEYAIADNGGYEWKSVHAEYTNAQKHQKVHKHANSVFNVKPFLYNTPELNYTRTLKINNNLYDAYTHEYLGNYLRFMRDYNNLDLMSMYNCFSNTLAHNLKIEIPVDAEYTAKFDTTDTNFKIYMVPIKLFKDYTIAINCSSEVEMCCGLFGEYQDLRAKFDNISNLTYQCFNSLQFHSPVLFTKVRELCALLTDSDAAELALNEDNLKLFIKLPLNNKSSITILEGDYTAYGDTSFYNIEKNTTSAIKYKACQLYSTLGEDKIYTTKISTQLGTVDKPITPSYNLRIDTTDVEESYDIEVWCDTAYRSSSSSLAKLKEKTLRTFRTSDFYANRTTANEPLVSVAVNYDPMPAMNNLSAELTDEEKKILASNTSIYIKMKNTFTKPIFLSYQVNSYQTSKAHTANMPNEIESIRKSNKTVINYYNANNFDVDLKLITPSQLLLLDTQESYPIADRLIEYLCGHAITHLDTNLDNVQRAKTVMSGNCTAENFITREKIIKLSDDGLWDPIIRPLAYDYINKHNDTIEINHDILGYIDRSVEKYYSTDTTDPYTNKKTSITISNVDIYGEEW